MNVSAPARIASSELGILTLEHFYEFEATHIRQPHIGNYQMGSEGIGPMQGSPSARAACNDSDVLRPQTSLKELVSLGEIVNGEYANRFHKTSDSV
jgi:hypothetical protein